MLIGVVIIHKHAEGNAAGDNFNEMAALKLNDSPVSNI